MKASELIKHHHVIKASKVIFWFSLGAILGLCFFSSFVFIFYRNSYKQVVYPGVFVAGIDFGGKTEEEVRQYFRIRNERVKATKFLFNAPQADATASAEELQLGYDEDLLAKQAYSIGRSENILSNISLIFQAYMNTITLPSAYRYSEQKLDQILKPVVQKETVEPEDALFTFQNGRVTKFRLAKDGQAVDEKKIEQQVQAKIPQVLLSSRPQTISIEVPIKVVKANSPDKTNDLGIKELVATGTSLFYGSIPNRIYNITLAANRLNGILIPPGQVFSFNKALGDISVYTGYKQAYVIQNGKTVLGDGGGVCQVSTTMFRAALNAGLPIMERNPHAYRVHYYEDDLGPGVDAAIYSPTVDLKFKNDTGHHLLIQSYVDPVQQSLTFELYGTKDGREVTVGKPVIVSQTPAPEPLYQDDPNLPKGQVKQVDFAAPGANVYFTRIVKKDGKVLLSDKFSSHYRPWQAVYMRGTKE